LSDRACYIQRSDRGARLVRARLLSERSDESWLAVASTDAAAAELSAIDAAEWIRDRLAETRTPKRLDTLCLDVDGAVCSWVKGREADAELIRSAVEGMGEAPAAGEEDGLEHGQAPGIADRLPRLPLEVSYDMLGDADPAARAAVLAAPDAPARLLMDRLDALGIRVGRVVTLWHALAEAWDPGARAAATDGANIIATEHPPAAVVAIDHDGARMVWAWAQSGTLLACGSLRLRRARADTRQPMAEVHEHDIARLAADWLGWSAQTGVCPARVVVVGRTSERGLSAGEIGTGLTRAWPGALTDLVGCDDAVAETLRRTLDARHINTFKPLTERPTRAHRSAFRWTALTLLVTAVCVGVLAALLFARAGRTKALAAEQRAARTEILTAVDPSLVMDPFPLGAIDSQIAQIERRTGAVREENPRPILAELETLSMVLGVPGVTLNEIEVNDAIVTVKVTVPDVETAEQVYGALRSIGGSELQWSPWSPRSVRDQIEVTITARWPQTRAGQ
jgi:hypothetical protein